MVEKVHRIHSLPDDSPWRGGLPPAGSEEHPRSIRALDRVLTNGHYSIPQWTSNSFLVGYRPGRFVLPKTVPRYYDAGSWAIATWWAAPTNK